MRRLRRRQEAAPTWRRGRSIRVGFVAVERLVVGHLFPEYLNIYADRGNIAVLARRAEWRGHELEVLELGMDDKVRPGEHDLYYVGGGQDREQELIAPALAAKGGALREAHVAGAAVLAVC